MSGTLTTSIIEDEAGAGAPLKMQPEAHMQNQYVGDIGDFGKYGLLRHLTGMRGDAAPEDALRLGVVWYLFPDEAPKDPNKPDNRDGSLTGYLCDRRDNHEKFRNCDTDLYDALHKIVYKAKIADNRLEVSA